MAHETIVILDFGSQYTQLIARRIREFHVYTEIHPFHLSIDKLRAMNPRGIILSGGPASCYEDHAPKLDRTLFDLGVPILGICYGFQLIGSVLGGDVIRADKGEYGRAEIAITDRACPLWNNVSDEKNTVWMSHGDRLQRLPDGFVVAAKSDNAPITAAWHPVRNIFGIQFHPEVSHSTQGTTLLKNFVFDVCGCRGTWTMASFIEHQVAAIHERVTATDHVVCALSGGVDSTVASVLVHRAIGTRLHCVFVDNGVLRQNEAHAVKEMFESQLRIPLTVVDAKSRFLSALRDVTDPEVKRKTIGKLFIDVFDEAAKRLDPHAAFLVQGTLYTDVIESVSVHGPSAQIKSHHNVGGLPEKMHLKLIEPLRELFKDEVRALGRELGISHDLLARQPFPGPGLAVRILGEVTESRVALLQRADAIIDEEIRAAGLYESIWQSFGVLLPVKTVGVMGDQRTYQSVLALRAVHSLDGMTADWVKLPYELLERISNRVINEVSGINRVVYDISSKPPATIEWE